MQIVNHDYICGTTASPSRAPRTRTCPEGQTCILLAPSTYEYVSAKLCDMQMAGIRGSYRGNEFPRIPAVPPEYGSSQPGEQKAILRPAPLEGADSVGQNAQERRPNNMGKHRKIGKTAIIVAAVIGGVGLLGAWGISQLAARLSPPGQTGVQTVEVVDGTIESTIAGTGTLEYEDAQDVTVPRGLEIVSVLQGQGRQVNAGDLLATVNKAACESQMSDTYAQIAETDQQLLNAPKDTESVTVVAPISGTVSVINAARGSSVLDVLASTGSLAVISSNGRKGIAISSEDPAAALPGETVLVDFADGNSVSATVDDVNEAGFTAALPDRTAAVGQEVTVRTPQGDVVGTGEVVSLDSADVVGPAGTVEEVRVTAGAKIEAGDVMFTVRPSGMPAEYAALEQQRTELTRQYDQLAVIASHGGIIAPISGTIVTCSVAAGQNTSALDSAAGGFAGGFSADGGEQVQFSAQDALGMFGAAMNAPRRLVPDSITLPAPEEDSQEPEAPDETKPVETTYPTEVPSACIPTEQPSDPTEIPVRSIPRVEVPLVPPIAGLPLQTKVAVLPVYAGTVEWTPADAQAQHATVYTAKVALSAMEGFTFAPDCTATVLNGAVEFLESTGGELIFNVTYPMTAEQLKFPEIDWAAIQDFLDASGSLDISALKDLLTAGLLPSSALGFDISSLYSQIDPSALYGQMDPSVLAGSLEGVSLPYDASSLIPDPGSVYNGFPETMSLPDAVAYTIAPGDTMQLVIEINQMDILSVHPGMRCAVTVDAISDTEFEGAVSEVSQRASSSGDYTARIVLPKDDRMRPGMTASATIVTQETADVLTLPVIALQEEGNRVFVYTGYDTSSDELTDELEVETGVSNGSDVEILAGLEPGQTVYYRPPDALREMMRMMGGSNEEDREAGTHMDPAQSIATP